MISPIIAIGDTGAGYLTCSNCNKPFPVWLHLAPALRDSAGNQHFFCLECITWANQHRAEPLQFNPAAFQDLPQ